MDGFARRAGGPHRVDFSAAVRWAQRRSSVGALARVAAPASAHASPVPLFLRTETPGQGCSTRAHDESEGGAVANGCEGLEQESAERA